MPTNTRIADIMTTHLFTVDYYDTVKKADEIMRTELVKYVPVLEDQKFVGIINETKILEYSLRQIYEFDNIDGEIGFNKISDYEKIIQKYEHIAYPEDSVQKAIKLIAKYRLDCLPIVDWDNNLKGLVTHTDILLFVHKLIEDGVL